MKEAWALRRTWYTACGHGHSEEHGIPRVGGLGSETCIKNGLKQAQVKNTLPACAFLAAAARRASRRLPGTAIRTCQVTPGGKDQAVSAWCMLPAADKRALLR